MLSSTAFVVVTNHRPTAGSSSSRFVSSQDLQQEQEMQCFIVNFDMVEEDGEIPEVFCTSEPEEFAWFHGKNMKDLKPTDIIKEEAFEECVEGASPRGLPEWECKVLDEDWQKPRP